ncbi:MAG: homoserine kinase [Cyanobacteriota bacterium erpe_2018_sw_21hr_WHONDRS-SW48-000092_B_bin.40]|nr:homoserine kinase [Cyanobacteriota bacterium erpe_2018_sw_21hr_WHONDRS-SW48-000092_B_bin.40]
MDSKSEKNVPPIKRKSSDVRPREYLTPSEVDSLGRAALLSQRNPLRDSALILLCYRHALGVRELIGLKWQDFDFDKKTLTLLRERSSLKTEHLLEADEIALLQSLRKKLPGSDLVFCSERKSALNERSISAIVSQAGRKANIAFPVNPSMLRHSKGHQLAQQGYESETIQAYLGQKTGARSRQYVQDGKAAAISRNIALACSDDVSAATSKIWRQQLQQGKSLTLRVPLSSCNLGPGLDTIGLALNLYVYVTLRLAEDSNVGQSQLITLKGEITKQSKGSDIGDLIYTLLKKLWKSDQNLLGKVRLSITSDIPLGSGMGTAGAAILGAVWAVHMLQGNLLSKAQLLSESCSVEGHLESMAASLLGSFVVCGGGLNGARGAERIVAQTIAWPEDWIQIAVVPSYTLTTPMSRRVLGTRVDLNDAIMNIRNSSSMVAAVVNSDAVAMREVLKDHLHEQPRANLVPALNSLRSELSDAPIIGCVLSGGGPSLMVLTQRQHKDEVLERIRSWETSQARRSSIFDLQVDDQGMTVIQEQTANLES